MGFVSSHADRSTALIAGAAGAGIAAVVAAGIKLRGHHGQDTADAA